MVESVVFQFSLHFGATPGSAQGAMLGFTHPTVLGGQGWKEPRCPPKVGTLAHSALSLANFVILVIKDNLKFYFEGCFFRGWGGGSTWIKLWASDLLARSL